MLYSIGRMGVEFFRGDNLYIFDGLRAAHGIGLIIVAVSLLGIIVIYHEEAKGVHPRDLSIKNGKKI